MIEYNKLQNEIENNLKSILESIKSAKEYTYNLSNICKNCKYGNYVSLWLKAKNEDIITIKKEIEKSFRMALARAKKDKHFLYWDSLIELFKSSFHIINCGHIKTLEEAIETTQKDELSFKQKLKMLDFYGIEVERRGKKDLEIAYKHMINKIDLFIQDEFITLAVKKNIDGSLNKNEIMILCKECEKYFLNKYEFNTNIEACEGVTCLFKHFVSKFSEQNGYKVKYVKPYGFWLLERNENNIIVSKEGISQPTINVMMFNPNLIICIYNFLSGKIAKPEHSLHYFYHHQNLKGKEILTKIAKEIAGIYLLPVIAYDLETDEYIFVPIKVTPPKINDIVKKLISIDFTVKPTEKTYKAAHDRIIEICEEIGLEFGFNSVREYHFRNNRVDVAWLDKKTEKIVVAIEVELAPSIIADLWKLCEVQPELGVLIVKGKYYQTAIDYILTSKIIEKFEQKLLVLDVSNKNYTLIEGSKLLTPLSE